MPPRRIELFRTKAFSVSVASVEGSARALRESFDVSRLPGAELVSSGAWESADARVVAGCVRGPSGRFVEGIEDVLFEKATWLSLRALAVEPQGLRAADPAPQPPRVMARALEGRTQAGDALKVQHVLAFHERGSALVLCSVACEGRCADVSLELEGAPDPQPPASLLMRAAFGAVSNWAATGGALAVVALIAAAVIVRLRPARP